jgi:hypothetical protein
LARATIYVNCIGSRSFLGALLSSTIKDAVLKHTGTSKKMIFKKGQRL